MNGKLLETVRADKVFVFHVALSEGMNTLTAKAGDIHDSTVFEKVAREPEIYTLPGRSRRP